MEDKKGLINREFLVAVPHPGGGGWTFVKDNVVGKISSTKQ